MGLLRSSYYLNNACENSKHEIRNPKQIQNSNVPMFKTMDRIFREQDVILFWSFEFWSFDNCFEFRYSYF